MRGWINVGPRDYRYKLFLRFTIIIIIIFIIFSSITDLSHVSDFWAWQLSLVLEYLRGDPEFRDVDVISSTCCSHRRCKSLIVTGRLRSIIKVRETKKQAKFPLAR